jgi:hypothetical protein
MLMPRFEEVLDAVDSLSTTDQEILIEVIRHRLAERRRDEIAANLAEARAAHQRGDVQRGSAKDLLHEALG